MISPRRRRRRVAAPSHNVSTRLPVPAGGRIGAAQGPEDQGLPAAGLARSAGGGAGRLSAAGRIWTALHEEPADAAAQASYDGLQHWTGQSSVSCCAVCHVSSVLARSSRLRVSDCD